MTFELNPFACFHEHVIGMMIILGSFRLYGGKVSHRFSRFGIVTEAQIGTTAALCKLALI